MGGSFNPIHHGHLIIAERAVEALKLDRMILIPTWITPLKSPREIAPGPHRLAMVSAAIRGNNRLAASDMELRRGDVSYSIDTVRALARPGRKIFWILGEDAAALLPQWRSIRDLAALCTFGIASRPHSARLRVPKYIEYRRVPAPLLEISGSEIRDRVRKGLSIRYLVPDGVEQYIRRKGLYR
jgi:nicotinate-nucleotide adenylyltransferase